MVEFYSDQTDYENETPGSWKVTKSAEWIGAGRARITFEVTSIPKYRHINDMDVIMVIDRSGSMAGQKIDQVINDATSFADELLSSPNNRIALVIFDSFAEVYNDFTNDKNEIIGALNGIYTLDSTNYYDGLVKAGDILEGYSRQENRDLILLFLTDGFPNINTPNEVAQYQTLKAAYPYMEINGIQYEMGDEILQPIINISDNQYVADMSTLNNVLVNATISPITYDTFSVTDFIDDTYWNVYGISSIDASNGSVSLDYDDETPIVSWDMSKKYRSGETETLTIDINLKSEYQGGHDESLLLPTNKHETITSRFMGSNDVEIDSDLTPILSDDYEVSYDENAPRTCDVVGEVPSDTKYLVYTPVEISRNKLSCDGFVFNGWQIQTAGVKPLNDDYFRMPEKDVKLIAVWSKLSIEKSMDGSVDTNRLMATFDVGETINQKMKRLAGLSNPTMNTKDTNITAIMRSNTYSSIVDPDNSDYIFSSSDSDAIIYGWYDNGVIYYYSEAEVLYLNPDSSFFFSHLDSLTNIDTLSDWKATKMTNMKGMFRYVSNVTSFSAVSNWNVGNVTDMSAVFASSGITDTNDISHWDTKNVTIMSELFLPQKTSLMWMVYANGTYRT